MKKLFLPFLLAIFIVGCEKDSTSLDGQNLTTNIDNLNRGPKPKVDICHYDADNDSWHLINVSENAWPAHEAHGDVLLVDNDGDGWVEAENECVPGGDCDDNDDTIHPGAEEVCGDGIDNNCDGQIDEGCVPDCCFNDAVDELNLTCWNGEPNQPILWADDPFYGLCSNCLPNCGYRTPILGYFEANSPAPEVCRLYLVQLAQDLGLGVGPNCTPSNNSQNSAVFGQQ